MGLNLKQLAIFLVGFSLSASASPRFSTRDLESKDFQEMLDLTQSETKKCYRLGGNVEENIESTDPDDINSSGIKQTPEMRACLKNVVAMVLTRREQNDPVQTKLLKQALSEIQDEQRTEVLKQLAKEAIDKYKDSKERKAVQATAYEQIKNILSEAKSRARLENEKEDMTSIITLVKNADLDVDSKLVSERANGPSGISPNLSEKAEGILQALGH